MMCPSLGYIQLECHQLNVLFQLCVATHQRAKTIDTGCVYGQPFVAGDKAKEIKRPIGRQGRILGGESRGLTTPIPILFVNWQKPKVLHLKKDTQLCLLHLLIAFALPIYGTSIATHPYIYDICPSRTESESISYVDGPLPVFCFNFTWQLRKLFRFLLLKCVKPLRHAFQKGRRAPVYSRVYEVWGCGWRVVYCFCHQFILQFVFFCRVAFTNFFSFHFFLAACFLGNLFHWTFVCLLGSPVNGMKRFVLLFSPPLRTTDNKQLFVGQSWLTWQIFITQAKLFSH